MGFSEIEWFTKKQIDPQLNSSKSFNPIKLLSKEKIIDTINKLFWICKHSKINRH